MLSVLGDVALQVEMVAALPLVPVVHTADAGPLPVPLA